MKIIKNKNILFAAIIFIISVSVSSAIFFLSYQYDNKYTSTSPQAKNGVLILDETFIEEKQLTYLIDGWEIYRNKLLSPNDFKDGSYIADEIVYIGQYGGFEGKNSIRSPHGYATYHMTISLPETKHTYTLDLPEIYSAYKLYVNGDLLMSMGKTGDIDNHKAETGISQVTFQASENIDIIFAVSDYSHFYSGKVYPPAFGLSDTVIKSSRIYFAIRCISCAVGFFVGIMYLFISIFHIKNKVKSARNFSFLYSSLCFAFVFYISHPIVKSLFKSGLLFNHLEPFAFSLILLLVVIIQNHVISIGKTLSIASTVVCSAFCLFSFFFPIFMNGQLLIMKIYSKAVGFYTVACAVYMISLTILGIIKGKSFMSFMLIGTSVFGTSLAFDRIFPLFEPIYFGWFTEIGTCLLVLFIGISLASEISSRLNLYHIVNLKYETVSKMLGVQKSYHDVLIEKEQINLAAKHDLRHHMLIMKGMLDGKKYQQLSDYLKSYSAWHNQPEEIAFCHNYIIDMLLKMYSGIAKSKKIEFRVETYMIPNKLFINDIDLCVSLSNILENALEASEKLAEEKREIFVSIAFRHNTLIILVKNKFSGNPIIKNGIFVSSKTNNYHGFGSKSVKAVAKRCGGSADFYIESNFFNSEIFLPNIKISSEKEAFHANCNL